jgi:lipoate-protein ligase A
MRPPEFGPPERLRRWRLIDSGTRPAVHNLALSRALGESRAAGEVVNTLRFFVSEPAALIGCAQSAAQELDVAQCRRESVAIERAVDTAPARFIDEQQLGWELFALRADLYRRDVTGVTHRIVHTVCDALATFGIEARLRGGSEIEVDGRRIGDIRVSIDGPQVWCQGALFLDFDAARAERILRTALGRPVIAHPGGIAAFRMGDRVTSLREQLGMAPGARPMRRALVEAFSQALGVRLVSSELSDGELTRYRIALREFSTPDWVGLMKRPSSEMPIVAASARLRELTLHAGVAYDLRGRRLREAWLSVEPAILPVRLLRDLEVAIRGVALDSLAQSVRRFFVAREVDLRGLRPADFSALVIRAVLHPERVLSG